MYLSCNNERIGAEKDIPGRSRPGRISEAAGKSIGRNGEQVLWLGTDAQPFSFNNANGGRAVEQYDEETAYGLRVIF